MTDLVAEMRDRYMAPQATLIERATEKVLAELGIAGVQDLKAQFDDVLVAIEVETYRLYLLDEKKMVQESVRELLLRPLSGPGPYGRDDVARIAEDASDELARLFMHLGQSRRSKAGRTFETNLRGLFRRLDYPFDEGPMINGKPDFLMPGKKLFGVNPAECIIFTAKRTLRERWRQITTEGKHFRLFLATIDEKVSENQLGEMLKQQVYLVIPKKKIEDNAAYRGAKNVISFEEFFRDFLDPAVKRWRAKGWIQ
jgi:hypothetical protein